jgi:hypothetical protein
LGQEKLTLGHNKMNHGTEQVDFLGQEKLNYGQNYMNFGLNMVTFWDRRIQY